MNDTLSIYTNSNNCQLLNAFHKRFYPSGNYDQDQNELLALAKLAAQNGWPVIPIVAKTKKPWIKEWPTIFLSYEATFDLFLRYFDTHRSIGIRTGEGVIGFDIDLQVKYDTDIITRLVEHMLGPTPLHRFGSKGMLLVYRIPLHESFNKIKLIRPKLGDEKRKALIEFLCWHNQFVAGGIHPDTKKPYY